MSSPPRPLHVVIVSEDTALLHELSWVLEAVGYEVCTTKDFEKEALWRRYTATDYVIVDGRSFAEPTAAIFAHESDDPIYRVFLYDPTKRTDFSAWYGAGAHDALRVPLSRGELLVRVRTGARYLEFERRLIHQSSRSIVPGMVSRRGLLRKLRKLSVGEEFGVTQHTLLVTEIDWYTGIRRKSGALASRGLVAAAARSIRRAVGENAVSAYLGEGRFATFLVGQSLAVAKSAADVLAKDFGSRESHHESIPRPTLTSAVVPWSADDPVDRLLNQALELLELATHSGGDCVLLQGDFSKELAAWQHEMTAGNPFDNVVAQDIMEPFPAVLQRGANQRELAETLRRSGIPVCPYVDSDGRLVGVAVAPYSAAETRIGEAAGAAATELTTPETIAHDASFPKIYEAFSSLGCATLVVTADEHPLGYLTCDGFLSMIDPIHSDSFTGKAEPTEGLDYLVVPSINRDTSSEVAAV